MKITGINPKLTDNDKSNDPKPGESEEGCDVDPATVDVDFSDLIGKTFPLEMTVDIGESGSGAVTLGSEGSSGSGSASYSTGRISATIDQGGGSFKLTGTFTRDDNGNVSAGGSGTMMGAGDWFAKVSWRATPK